MMTMRAQTTQRDTHPQIAATLGLPAQAMEKIKASYDVFTNPAGEFEIVMSTIGWEPSELAELSDLAGASISSLEERYLIFYFAE